MRMHDLSAAICSNTAYLGDEDRHIQPLRSTLSNMLPVCNVYDKQSLRRASVNSKSQRLSPDNNLYQGQKSANELLMFFAYVRTFIELTIQLLWHCCLLYSIFMYDCNRFTSQSYNSFLEHHFLCYTVKFNRLYWFLLKE
ncbi:hypothetical protein TNCV_5046921 [Trichonephila clavipes]|nr:hypothetical protein TNCV_5046921 [Trichonephila clavipes]